MSEGHAAAGAMVSSGPKLQLKAMSGSMTLQQPGSVFMSVTPVTPEAVWMPTIWACPCTWPYISQGLS